MLRIFNTLSKQIEEFEPQNPPKVTMYTCGPTVYDYMHIGNLRTFVFSDILQRVLKYNGFQVQTVQNITDIDDKIIKRAKEKGATIGQISEEFTEYFLEDTQKLNIEKPQVQPKATEYVKKMIEYVQDLVRKGFAYAEEDGSVYFDISKFKGYGKLSGVEKRELKTGTRILSDEYTKEDVQDFALWKTVGEDEVGFDSSWGKGRPGWHIECSVMSQSILGNKIDLHLGGVDLIFPHHENEIAQSEAKTGESPFVKYWVHGAHVLVNGKKMSKSLHNFFTLSELEKQEFEPLSLRYLYLQTHYRQEMNFTLDALEGAQNALNNLKEEVSTWDKPEVGCAEFEERFLEAINEDLNMPKALAVMWELVKSDYPTSAKAESLFKFDKVLGLKLSGAKKKLTADEIPPQVLELVKERDELRKQKRFHLADQLRGKIKKLGYDVEDKEDKTEIKRVI
ncbi:MAG: cysteine--tRNA ligase [Patescibacteria group bacterium]|nr:cysteine--tRNA ligase [Patescibacteria group bacterium]